MNQKLAGIQILRAVAAIMVVLWHLGGVSRNFQDIDVIPPEFLMFGEAGVDLFFVISGFIICHISLTHPFRWQDFVRKRCLRIYPIYAFFSVLALLAWFANPTFTFGAPQPTLISVVESLLLWPQEQYPLLFVGWSLEHEIQFYIIVGLLFTFGRPQMLPFLLAGLFSLGIVLQATFGRFWDWHLLTPYYVEFAFGTLVYFHQQTFRKLGWFLPLLAGIALLSVTGWAVETHQMQKIFESSSAVTAVSAVRSLGFGVGSLLLLCSVLNANFAKIRSPILLGVFTLMVYLGDSSFTLYLSHPFIISAVGKVGQAIHAQHFVAVLVLIAAFVAACLFSVVFYAILEKPFLAYIHRRAAKPQ